MKKQGKASHVFIDPSARLAPVETDQETLRKPLGWRCATVTSVPRRINLPVCHSRSPVAGILMAIEYERTDSPTFSSAVGPLPSSKELWQIECRGLIAR
jgi:hypothetical protein